VRRMRGNYVRMELTNCQNGTFSLHTRVFEARTCYVLRTPMRSQIQPPS
jgi:hypothetical protein